MLGHARHEHQHPGFRNMNPATRLPAIPVGYQSLLRTRIATSHVRNHCHTLGACSAAGPEGVARVEDQGGWRPQVTPRCGGPRCGCGMFRGRAGLAGATHVLQALELYPRPHQATRHVCATQYCQHGAVQPAPTCLYRCDALALLPAGVPQQGPLHGLRLTPRHCCRPAAPCLLLRPLC